MFQFRSEWCLLEYGFVTGLAKRCVVVKSSHFWLILQMRLPKRSRKYSKYQILASGYNQTSTLCTRYHYMALKYEVCCSVSATRIIWPVVFSNTITLEGLSGQILAYIFYFYFILSKELEYVFCQQDCATTHTSDNQMASVRNIFVDLLVHSIRLSVTVVCWEVWKTTLWKRNTHAHKRK